MEHLFRTPRCNIRNKKGGETELVLYQKVSIGTGKQGTNPWLQELPDPITKQPGTIM
jgi:hypothetical protein